ncbi:DUF3540 domain-containing protein [Massilia sp. W12]|uniref:DUF3540 domain-containing protein n=1 Tax=Massilia sp. W12 TaxID=3126507 RepID=UPI0030D3A766
MMRSAEKTDKQAPPAPLPLQLSEARIAVVLQGQGFMLDDGRVARQALSCLVTPEVGDHVLTAAGHDNPPYILHVLARQNPQHVALSVPGAGKVSLQQDTIELQAQQAIALQALRDIEISAATGVLQLNACNLFSTVHESVVQHMRHYVGRAQHFLLEAEQLLRLHGEQTLITAEQDIKVDSERISLG